MFINNSIETLDIPGVGKIKPGEKFETKLIIVDERIIKVDEVKTVKKNK